MKFVINEYNLSNPKIKHKIDIICISDIHSNVKKLKMIKNFININKIKILLIPGDLVDTVYDKRNDEILKVMEDISKNTTIYISKGNHDMIKNRKQKDGNITLENKFYKKLSSLKNVKVFNHEVDSVSLTDNISINSFTLPFEWYLYKEKISNFEKYYNNNLKTDKNKFNILLTHTPVPLIKNNMIRQDLDLLRDMNLILCGHMHAGLKPICFRNNNTHRGLIGPCLAIFPKTAYGFYNNNTASLLISGGVTKISYLSIGKKVTSFFDNMFASEIELIHLKPSKKHNFELSKRTIKKEQLL